MHIQLGAATHTGRVRQHNEDAVLATEHLVVIADGMGGHARGDLASMLTVEAFRPLEGRQLLTPADVEASILAANQSILAAVGDAPELDGMGTTVTGLALVEYAGHPHWLVFNIGDSRVYRVSGPAMELLTVDHSEVAELVALGHLTEQEALTHPLRHIVTRSLGTDPAPAPDVWIFPVSADGETFVGCSDGLTNELGDESINAVVQRASTPQDAADGLVSAAVSAGGRDNVTVAVLTLHPETIAEFEVATGPRGRLA